MSASNKQRARTIRARIQNLRKDLGPKRQDDDILMRQFDQVELIMDFIVARLDKANPSGPLPAVRSRQSG